MCDWRYSDSGRIRRRRTSSRSRITETPSQTASARGKSARNPPRSAPSCDPLTLRFQTNQSLSACPLSVSPPSPLRPATLTPESPPLPASVLHRGPIPALVVCESSHLNLPRWPCPRTPHTSDSSELFPSAPRLDVPGAAHVVIAVFVPTTESALLAFFLIPTARIALHDVALMFGCAPVESH